MTEPHQKRLRFLRELGEVPANLSLRERDELSALEEIERMDRAATERDRAIARLVGMVEGVAIGLETAAGAEWNLDVAVEQRRIAAILRDALKTSEIA